MEWFALRMEWSLACPRRLITQLLGQLGARLRDPVRKPQTEKHECMIDFAAVEKPMSDGGIAPNLFQRNR